MHGNSLLDQRKGDYECNQQDECQIHERGEVDFTDLLDGCESLPGHHPQLPLVLEVYATYFRVEFLRKIIHLDGEYADFIR